MKKKPHTPKRLAQTLASEFAARPGQLPAMRGSTAFLHRARHGHTKDSAKILAAAQLLQEKLYSQVAHATLLILERLFGVQNSSSQPTSRRIGKRLARQQNLQTPRNRTREMLETLLAFMQDQAAEAVVAQLILNDQGELQADDYQRYLDDTRRKIPGERPTSLWAKPASDDPIVRLRR